MFVIFIVLILALLGIVLGLSMRRINRKLWILLVILTILAAAASLVSYFTPLTVQVAMRLVLKNLETTFSRDGICIQTTGYTCGPAAAVTVLRQLGVEAKESDLAILSKCTLNGTTNEQLVDAINKLYGKKGIDCAIRNFDSIDQLKEICPVIAVIKLSPVIGHYTVVLEVTDDKVIVGDPIAGKKEWSHEDFKKKWLLTGIALKKR